ncbi:MAG: carbohydrate ABC transporter permease [Chloroflexi bacterium]|nr:carbohydrate ABC transporter permease [Chloroflexota bacterium]
MNPQASSGTVWSWIRRWWPKRWYIHLILMAGAVVVIAPLLWMITLSLKPARLTYSPPYLIPNTFEWQNYVDAWEAAPFARYYLNTALMALGITGGQLIFSSLAAYAFARLKFRGASRFGVWWRIILPLSRPALATLAIFAFLFSLNDFLWPLIVADDPDMRTIQLGLVMFQGRYGTNWTLLMAGTVTATIPTVIAFLFGQRQFIESIALSGVKE